MRLFVFYSQIIRNKDVTLSKLTEKNILKIQKYFFKNFIKKI